MIAESNRVKESAAASLENRAKKIGAYAEVRILNHAQGGLVVELVYVLAGLGGMIAAVAAPLVALGVATLGGFSVAGEGMGVAAWFSSWSIVDQSHSALSTATFYCAVLTLVGSLLFMGGATCGVILEARPRYRRAGRS